MLLAIRALPLVAGQSPFIEAFFKPFAYLDIEHIYETYHAIIDFLLFTLTFTSIAQATVGKRLSTTAGGPGRSLSVGLGIVLGLSLVLTETALGFSLRSLGPVAALVIGSVAVLLLYRVTRQLGLARVPAIFLTSCVFAVGYTIYSRSDGDLARVSILGVRTEKRGQTGRRVQSQFECGTQEEEPQMNAEESRLAQEKYLCVSVSICGSIQRTKSR